MPYPITIQQPNRSGGMAGFINNLLAGVAQQHQQKLQKNDMQTLADWAAGGYQGSPPAMKTSQGQQMIQQSLLNPLERARVDYYKAQTERLRNPITEQSNPFDELAGGLNTLQGLVGSGAITPEQAKGLFGSEFADEWMQLQGGPAAMPGFNRPVRKQGKTTKTYYDKNGNKRIVAIPDTIEAENSFAEKVIKSGGSFDPPKESKEASPEKIEFWDKSGKKHVRKVSGGMEEYNRKMEKLISQGFTLEPPESAAQKQTSFSSARTGSMLAEDIAERVKESAKIGRLKGVGKANYPKENLIKAYKQERAQAGYDNMSAADKRRFDAAFDNAVQNIAPKHEVQWDPLDPEIASLRNYGSVPVSDTAPANSKPKVNDPLGLGL